jgi:hypothetical protein
MAQGLQAVRTQLVEGLLADLQQVVRLLRVYTCHMKQISGSRKKLLNLGSALGGAF